MPSGWCQAPQRLQSGLRCRVGTNRQKKGKTKSKRESLQAVSSAYHDLTLFRIAMSHRALLCMQQPKCRVHTDKPGKPELATAARLISKPRLPAGARLPSAPSSWHHLAGHHLTASQRRRCPHPSQGAQTCSVHEQCKNVSICYTRAMLVAQAPPPWWFSWAGQFTRASWERWHSFSPTCCYFKNNHAPSFQPKSAGT